MKAIKEFVTQEESKDIEGRIIPKGTKLHVIKQLPKAPFGDNHHLLIVRVDNGTGILKLMLKTTIRDTEVKGAI